jgi:hypothetical protein
MIGGQTLSVQQHHSKGRACLMSTAMRIVLSSCWPSVHGKGQETSQEQLYRSCRFRSVTQTQAGTAPETAASIEAAVHISVHPQNVQLHNVQLQNVQLQNVHLPNVQLQNVQVTKCPGYQRSILQNVQNTKRPGHKTSSFRKFKNLFKKICFTKYIRHCILYALH